MIETLMNKTISVYTATRTSDGRGGWTLGYSLNRSIVGRISQKSGKEGSQAVSHYGEVTYTVYTLEALKRGDFLLVDGLELEVLTVRNPSLISHHFESDCKEVQVGISGLGGV